MRGAAVYRLLHASLNFERGIVSSHQVLPGASSLLLCGG